MSRFILDASVTLCWCFENQATHYTEAVFETLAGGGEALELAIREGLPLATLDNDLRRAAKAGSVRIAGTR